MSTILHHCFAVAAVAAVTFTAVVALVAVDAVDSVCLRCLYCLLDLVIRWWVCSQLSFFWPSLIFIDHADQSEASICPEWPIRSFLCQW